MGKKKNEKLKSSEETGKKRTEKEPVKKKTEGLSQMKEVHESDYMTSKYQYVIDNIVCKLNLINADLKENLKRPVIQKISSRIKTCESICKKLERKKIELDYDHAVSSLNDLVGVRAICFFKDDIYRIADAVKAQKGIRVIKEKDYIEKPKKSGYQSLHIIVEVPLIYYEREEYIRAEIQIRSFAMDYWAELDNQMCYKKSAGEVEAIRKEILSYSDVMTAMDSKMLELRKRIEKDLSDTTEKPDIWKAE